MRSKIGRQVLSFVLSIIFVLELVPASALAVGANSNLTEEAEAAVVPGAEETACVIGEMDELREEAVKHFRMSDGSFLAVQYDGPVHYQDIDGEWQDIDNTLRRSGDRYVTQNGAVSKAFAASLDSGLLFETSYQAYSIGMSLVTKLDRTAPVQLGEEILEAVVEETSEEAPPEEAAVETGPALAEETAETETESPTEAAAPEENETAEKAQPQEPARFALRKVQDVEAQVENPKAVEKIAGESTMDQMIQPERLTSDVHFADAFENTDLIYQNHGYNIKESIVIKRQQDAYSYSFALNLDGLTPELQENGDVLLCNADGEGIFVIPAPYLQDANGQTSVDAAYTLTETTGEWVLTVEADPAWLNAEDRAFPVVLDPTVMLHNTGNVKTSFIRSSWPDAKDPNKAADQYCGFRNQDGYGVCEICVQVESLPTIPKNCVPVGSQIMMCHLGYFSSDFSSTAAPSGQMTVEAHEWKGATGDQQINVAELTWWGVYRDSNGVDDTVLDFKMLSKSTLNQYISWDITPAVMKWLTENTTKYGIILKSPDGGSLQRVANLIGSGYYQYSPYLVIQYRNPVGLEDYYTYQEASAGKAGAAYISDFTQQLTVDHTDVAFSSEAVPYTLRHVYNTANAGSQFLNNSTYGIHTCDFSRMKVGDGWKLSAQQTVVPVTVGSETYLVYQDEDGTEHYFQSVGSNKYADEDGLGLTIVKSTSGSNTIYTMTDTDAYHTWVFHNGYLISITDSNSNAIYFAYNNSYSASSTTWKPTASGNRLVQIVAVANTTSKTPVTVASLAYTSDDYLQSITDYAGRKTTYTYGMESNRTLLKTIGYPDGTAVNYTYDSSDSNTGRMTALYDAESGYGISVSHQQRNGVWSTNKVTEFTAGSITSARTEGNAFHAFRNGTHMTSYRFYGADHARDTEDDIITYCVMDHYGKTINIYDMNSTRTENLGVSMAAYTQNSGTSAQNNRLTHAAALGRNAVNLLSNSGAESGSGERAATDWKRLDFVSSGVSAFGGYPAAASDIKTRTGRAGLKCWVSPEAASGSAVCMYQEIRLTGDTTYTFSGYVNTSDVSSFPENSGVYLAFYNGSTLLKKSDEITYKTVEEIDGGWEKISVTYTPQTSGNYRVAFVQNDAREVAYCDDLQLEIGAVSSDTNLIQNGSFEVYGDTGLPFFWNSNRYTLSVVSDPASSSGFGKNSMTATGGTGGYRRMNQEVQIQKPAKDKTFILSGWSKATSVGGTATKHVLGYEKYYGLVAAILYTDGTTEEHYVSFNADYTDWQYASGVVVPKESGKTISTITVHCAYDYNANRVYFDNISLIAEPVQTYSYDSKGNPIAATDGKAKTAYEYYSGTSKIKNYTTPSGTKHELWYDAKNNVQEERLHNLSTYTDYNFAGGVKRSITRVGYTGDYLASYNEYSPNLHFKTKSQDVNGITTEYEYNDPTRTLASVKNAYGTEQAYGYIAANDRMLQTYIDSVDAIWYAYQNGQLSTLTRKSFPALGSTANPFWQQYALAYDAFGNTTQVSVSGSTDGSTYAPPVMLASYAYENNTNGRLAQMAYGNGDTVNYTYDLFDRKTAETYNDGTSYHYEYDAEGSLAGQYATDAAGATTERYAYEYDSLGRLIHSKELDGSGNMVQRTEHLYDTSNRVRAQNWMFANGASFGQDYSYSNGADGDGTLTKVVSSATMDGYGFYPSVTYTYNTLRQLTRKTTDNLFYRAYSYRLLNGGERRSAQVEFMNYRRSDDNSLLLGYRYTYDEQGNVSAVYKSKASGGVESTAAQAYTYDALGQLTAVTDNDAGYTYSYTYGTAGNIRSAAASGQSSVSKTFSYDNASWPDLLTSVTVGGTTKSIAYETVNGNLTGNPITYYNGSDYIFTWSKGTQLTSATKKSTTTTYAYDMSGVRSSKTVGGTTYTYTTLSGLVMQQTDGTQELYFLYDDSNQPYAMVYKSSATAEPLFYYYLLNVQGDVVALMNASGEIVAEYQYDPWGVPTVMNSSGTVMEQSTFIGNINPLRYRGYYYDTETGFYYLQSRYYDPVIGRFISADTFATTDCNGFLSSNMFAYCENNPVMCSDPVGELKMRFDAETLTVEAKLESDLDIGLYCGVQMFRIKGRVSSLVGLGFITAATGGGTAAAAVAAYATLFSAADSGLSIAQYTTDIVNAISIYKAQGNVYVSYTPPKGITDFLDYSSSVSNSSTINSKQQVFVRRTQYRQARRRSLRTSTVKRCGLRISRITWRRR